MWKSAPRPNPTRGEKEVSTVKRTRHIAAIAAGVAIIGGGTALAAHVSEVDPTTVPAGFLAAHNEVTWMGPKEAKNLKRIADRRRADIFVHHLTFGPNEATPWHTHPGPVIVTVVRGSFIYEHERGDKCRHDVYEAGEGFVDRGFGKQHRGIAGPEGAHLYAIYLLPHESATHVIPVEPEEVCVP
jgi:quercetin dioxygenase-like cupin family protein